MKTLSFDVLTGRGENHLQELTINQYSFKIHKDIVIDLLSWQKKSQLAGIDFAVASAFRSYDRQLKIWNEKIQGQRPLKNKKGEVLDPKELSDEELLDTILLWSHIPGVSRHHWGTDLDIFDATWYKKNGAKLELENHFYLGDGPNAKMHLFNEQLLAQSSSAFAFYRPYTNDKNFMPELWHYSHQKIATQFQDAYTFPIFVKNLKESDELLLRDLLLSDAQHYYEKFVTLC
jgi:LAS superfamily LD-carboxypeptidase LdcB